MPYGPKVRAHKLILMRVKRGTLKKGPCEVCGAVEVEAHHDDYNMPGDVRWLCFTHHREWHKNNKAVEPKGDWQRWP